MKSVTALLWWDAVSRHCLVVVTDNKSSNHRAGRTTADTQCGWVGVGAEKGSERRMSEWVSE